MPAAADGEGGASAPPSAPRQLLKLVRDACHAMEVNRSSLLVFPPSSPLRRRCRWYVHSRKAPKRRARVRALCALAGAVSWHSRVCLGPCGHSRGGGACACGEGRARRCEGKSPSGTRPLFSRALAAPRAFENGEWPKRALVVLVACCMNAAAPAGLARRREAGTRADTHTSCHAFVPSACLGACLAPWPTLLLSPGVLVSPCLKGCRSGCGSTA